jgi:hypothetical protein
MTLNRRREKVTGMWGGSVFIFLGGGWLLYDDIADYI